MIFEESYTLHNGVAIPKLALGTWFIDDDKAAEAVRAAVNIGYRHIDTAQAYGNERGVAQVYTCQLENLFVNLPGQTLVIQQCAALPVLVVCPADQQHDAQVTPIHPRREQVAVSDAGRGTLRDRPLD